MIPIRPPTIFAAQRRLGTPMDRSAARSAAAAGEGAAMTKKELIHRISRECAGTLPERPPVKISPRAARRGRGVKARKILRRAG